MVKSTSSSPELPLQELEGTLERLTYQNEVNGYTVARLIPRGKTYEVTVVGPLTGVNVGSTLHLKGQWTTHTQYGKQFEISSYTIQLPATIEGIRKYLGSGLIRGIGPVTAGRIVAAFGIDTLAVIENDIHRLSEVPGIGEKRTGWIATAWEAQKQIKEIMLFLQSNGVSTGLAVKIYKQYGEASIGVVKNDPYRLSKDIFGIGFKTADKIALQLGLTLDSPARLQAGLTYTLSKLSDEGHCFANRSQLIDAAGEILEVKPELCQAQLDVLTRQNDLVNEDDAIYLPAFYHAERGVANRIRRMQAAGRDRLSIFRDVDWDKAFAWLDEKNNLGGSPIHLTDQQKTAIRMALSEKVSVLTGGPGTGKSTITGSLIHLLVAKNCSVLLAAPTGRAARRLSEATGLEAKTIHRLLEFSPSGRNPFQRDQENPLDADLIIIDETSMVDILLMYHLLNAVEIGAHLLLVGDVDQLPSVGPGNVLRDIIDSAVTPVTRLETIFRQAEDSFIIVNAHRINQGQMPLFPKNSSDFFFFAESDPHKAADWVLDLIANRIPAKFGYRADGDIQVLSPMHRGAVGVADLNEHLQQALNPPGSGRAEIRHGQHIFREGDRVMQIRNNYDLQVFNGDLGQITRIDLEDQAIQVYYEERAVAYDFTQLDELVHAYAISIHKSQGSEFPVVIIPLLTQHYMMLQRNLLYTGVTRARKIVVLVGSRQAIGIAIKNNRIGQRNTRLAQRLKDYISVEPADRGYKIE